MTYKHTVFMSYAFKDDEAWYEWISHFDEELNRGLQARLGEYTPPVTLMGGRNGPITGGLDGQLESLVEASFAMIIFVHDAYLRSDWCLRELRHFRDCHGKEAFNGRLFIVAMSEPAINRLAERPDWLEFFPAPDPVWMPFYDEQTSDQPLGMYIKRRRGYAAVIDNDFLVPFFALRETLVTSIRDAAYTDPDLFATRKAPTRMQAPVVARTKSAEPTQPVDVLTYIESDPEQKQFWEQLGSRVSEAWNVLMAKQSEDRQEPRLLLRPTGLAMRDLHERPRLDNADGVILLWGQKTEESLLAQIALVEPKLSSARPPAPCMVAYLVDDTADSGEDVPERIKGWPVVRFRTEQGEGGAVVVFDDDAAVLGTYLEDVLQIKLQPPPAAQPA